MNFVLKNLGWILLFFFFLFMLFIISTNQKKDLVGETLSGVSISQSASGKDSEADVKELEELVQQINKEEGIISQEEIITDPKKNKSIFDIFKRKNNINQEKEQVSSESQTIIEKEEKVDLVEKQNKETPNFVTQEATMNDGMDLVKNTGTSVALKMSNPSGNVYKEGDINLSSKFPGLNLVTIPGKEFQIGVHSLKLNNKGFTEKLGFVMKGDIVKQLSPENKRGCFEIEVIETVISNSIGKKAYVCKKYLSDVLTDTQVEESIPPESIQGTNDTSYTVDKKYFRANTPTSLKTEALQDTDVRVSISDVLLQVSPVTRDECFSVKVVGSNIETQYGKRGYVCVKELSSYSIVQ